MLSSEGEYATTVGDLLAVVHTINQAIVEEPAITVGILGPRASLLSKLNELLDKLISKLKQLAEKYSAVSYSVTVGAPVGVSVTVTFGTGD